MSTDDGSTEYGLVMPFVPVRSKGGPHDDAAYVAGYEMGKLDAELARCTRADQIDQMIHAENAEQADLIAMRHGFTAVVGEEQDGWRRLQLAVATEVDP